MRNRYRVTIAVNSAIKDSANDFWKQHIDKEGGENTFTNGLSSNGRKPYTWYICETIMERRHVEELMTFAENNKNSIKVTISPHQGGSDTQLNRHSGKKYLKINKTRQRNHELLGALAVKANNDVMTNAVML